MTPQPYRDNQENLLDYIHLCTLSLALTDVEGAESAFSEILGQWELIERREAVSGPEAGLTLPLLRRALSLDGCAGFCVAFALACELDGHLRGEVQTRCGCPAPTFDLVLSLYSACRQIPLAALFSCPNPDASPLRHALRLEAGFSAAQPLLAGAICLRRNILHFLVSGSPAPNRYYEILDFRGLDALPLHEQVYRAADVYLSDAMDGAPNRYFFLTGAPGAGKRTLVRRLAAARGLPCASLDCAALAGLDAEQLDQLSIELAADLALTGAVLCIRTPPPERAGPLEILLRGLPVSGLPLFLLCREENAPPPPLGGWFPLPHALSALSAGEYGASWERLRARYPVEPGFPESVPVYRLTIGQMEQVWVRAAHFCRCERRERISARDLSAAVRQLNAPSGYAAPIRSEVTLDDVIVSGETKARLRLICDFARQKRTVLGGWGFAARLPYGRGVTALLCGASGTGKTMAAAAIANELGLELLRLDLSQILDKYIGETEKKLAAVFDAASQGNYVLFFDEADALFSKRTEISSSHDRYANVETSFLLQSIEQYDGIVLLATNLFKNFDEAFLRRINIIARFPLPDEALRRQLWESVFPPEAPLAPGLEFALLARELELTPAVIKSAALTAAVLAASEGAAVGMGHLLSGLRGELEKFGQEARLAALAPLFGESGVT